MTYGMQSYQKMNKANASPLQLVVDLYEECVSKLEEALKAIQEDRFEDRYLATERVRKILMGLTEALDTSTPSQEEAAQNLRNYYSVIGGLLLRTDVHNDQESCMAAIESLRQMAQGWREIQRSTMVVEQPAAATPSSQEHHSLEISA